LIDTAKRRRVDAVAKLLRPDVADEVRDRVGVAVHVAIEAGHARRGLQAATVVREVELLLRKLRHEETHPLELLRREDAAEQPIVVLRRDELALRDVAEIGARGEKHRRRKLGDEVLRKVVGEIEPLEVAPLLLLHFADVRRRKEHPALAVVGMRQREEALRPEPLLANLRRGHRGELGPGDALREASAHAALHRLFARHRHAGNRAVREIVAFGEERARPRVGVRLVGAHLLVDLVEALDGDGGVAGLAATRDRQRLGGRAAAALRGDALLRGGDRGQKSDDDGERPCHEIRA
jgi:hypothetical protein